MTRLTLLALLALTPLAAGAQDAEDALAGVAGVLHVFVDDDRDPEESDDCVDCLQCGRSDLDGGSDSCLGTSNEDETGLYIAAGVFVVIALAVVIFSGKEAEPLPASTAALPADPIASLRAPGVRFVSSPDQADVVLSVRPVRQRHGIGAAPAPDRLAVRASDARTGAPLPLGSLGASGWIVPNTPDALASLLRR